jgi:hypothetical protein
MLLGAGEGQEQLGQYNGVLRRVVAPIRSAALAAATGEEATVFLGHREQAGILWSSESLDHTGVLVHCTHGWNRTPLIVCLAQLIIDEDFRTGRVYFWGFVSFDGGV